MTTSSSDHEIGLWQLLKRWRGGVVEAVVILLDALPGVVPNPALRAIEGVQHLLHAALDARRPLGHPTHPALSDATLARLRAPFLTHLHGLRRALGCHTGRTLGRHNGVADV